MKLSSIENLEDGPDPSKFGPRGINYVETMKIQSSIDRHMKLNRFWNRLQRFSYRNVNSESDSDNDNDNDSDDDDEEEYYGGSSVEQRNAVAQRRQRQRKEWRKFLFLVLVYIKAKKGV